MALPSPVDSSVSVPLFYGLMAAVALCWLVPALVPLRLLNSRLAGPDPELEGVVKAARSGEWEPAADLLTAAGPDADLRTHYAMRLAYTAAHDGDVWLRTWQADRPSDPDAVLVSACTRVEQAWKVRGGRAARFTSQNRFAGFHQELEAAHEEFRHAAAVLPDDPTPLAGLVRVATGLGWSKDDMGLLWARITATSPHHFNAHVAALQYFCRKWRGSRGEAEKFAAQAAEDAPRGSLLSLLPLIAWYEHQVVDTESGGAGFFRMPDVMALVDAALEDVSAAGSHPNLPNARHLLAYFLVRQGRYRAALEQLRQVDGYCGALPWTYHPWPGLSYRTHRMRAVWGALLTRR
ncbi:hypothetical protein ABZ924_17650 [Streptomyces sp. NPDC046876]|uniref:hypothetical protein n=1 Tax=Streptomyces sp. NPDC046876 TaxID=3155616 RepID=UPI0033E445AE